MSEMSGSRNSLAKVAAFVAINLIAAYFLWFTPIVRSVPLPMYLTGGDVAHVVFNGSAPACDPSLWEHIYNRSRIKLLRPCATITGTIIGKRPEKDGDIHTFLKVDPQFDYMLNDMNRTHEKGALIIEPMCVGKVTQEDAKKACRGFSQNFPDLKVGSHVEVTGVYIFDREHGHNELHPVTSIKKLSK